MWTPRYDILPECLEDDKEHKKTENSKYCQYLTGEKLRR